MFSGEKKVKNEFFRFNESGYDFSTIFDYLVWPKHN